MRLKIKTSKCRWCGNPTRHNNYYCSNGCKTQFNSARRGLNLQKEIMEKPRKALGKVIVTKTGENQINSFSYHWVACPTLRTIIDFGKKGRTPLFLLNIKPGDVIKINIEVVSRI